MKREKAVALLLVILMTISIVGVAEMPIVAAAAPKSTTLTATPPASATVGKSFAVTGTLKAGGIPVVGKTIKLYKVSGWIQTLVGTSKTGTSGSWTVQVTEKAARTYTYRAMFVGDSQYRYSTASTTVVVKPFVPLTTTTLTLTPLATAANTVKNTSKTLVKPSATLIKPSASAAPAPKFTPPAPVKYSYHVAIVVHCAGTMCNKGYSEYYGDLQPYYANNPRVTTTLTHGNTLYNATFENGAPNANWVSATILETGQVVYFQWGYVRL